MDWSLFKRKYKQDVSNVPKHILPLLGTKRSGPNCWNATILFFNPEQDIKYVPPEAMNSWLRKNTRKDDMKLCRPGDIFVLRNREEGLLHTAVWVAPGILFHKKGCTHEWELVSEKEIREIYCEATIFHYRKLKSETIKR